MMRSAPLTRGILLTLLAALHAVILEASDPFYEKLLGDGKRALSNAQPDEAALDLEIACFGLLDEPDLLADGLGHLAIAQSRAGDTVGLDETVDRLLSLEETHQGYSRAELMAETRAEIEQILLASVSLDRLRGIEAFRPIAHQRGLQVLMATRPAQRRELLQGRLERDPQDFQALQLLADLELSQGNPGAALPHLDALVALSGGDPTTVCRRFRAAATAGNCAMTLQDLEACPLDASEAGLADSVLECLVDAPQLARASSFVDTLPANIRSSPKVRKLERRLGRETRAAEGRTAADSAVASSPTQMVAQSDAVPETKVGAALEPEVELEPSPLDPTRASTATTATGPPATATDPCGAFRAAALGGRCTETTSAQASCPEVASEPDVARAVTKCYIQARNWSEAKSFLGTLPPQVSGLPKLRKLERQADKGLARLQKQTAEVSDAAMATAATASGESEDPASSPPTTQGASTAPAAPAVGELNTLRRQLDSARTAQDLNTALAVAVNLAYTYPESAAAQFLAAEAAYRAAQWQQAVRLFDAGGDPGSDRPLLLFYKAVALFEIGDTEDAASYLQRALPYLQKTAFVESYAERILAASRGPG